MSDGTRHEQGAGIPNPTEIPAKRNRAARQMHKQDKAAGRPSLTEKDNTRAEGDAASATALAAPARSPTKSQAPLDALDSPAGVTPPPKQLRSGSGAQTDQQTEDVEMTEDALTMDGIQQAVLSLPDTANAPSVASTEQDENDNQEVTPPKLAHPLAHQLAHRFAHQLFRLARTQHASRVDALRPPLIPDILCWKRGLRDRTEITQTQY